MRGTGNNRHSNEKILSIRLSPDGLSFSVISPSGKDGGEVRIELDHSAGSMTDAVGVILESREEFSEGYSSVQIFLDTVDTVYVPAEVVDEGQEPSVVWLNRAGVYPTETQKIIVSPAVGEVCAVMAFDGGAIDRLKAKFGGRAAFFSPLQENIEMKGRLDMGGGCYIVNITEDNFYLTAFDAAGQLYIAEVYPYASGADIVYYLHRISGIAPGDRKALRRLRIYLYGDCAPACVKTLRKYFRRAVCV